MCLIVGVQGRVHDWVGQLWLPYFMKEDSFNFYVDMNKDVDIPGPC